MARLDAKRAAKSGDQLAGGHVDRDPLEITVAEGRSQGPAGKGGRPHPVVDDGEEPGLVGDRDVPLRHRLAPVDGAAAQQGLGLDGGAGGEVDDGRVPDVQPAGGHGVAQNPLGLEALGGPRLERLPVDLVAIAPPVLGAVHGQVGLAQQVVGQVVRS